MNSQGKQKLAPELVDAVRRCRAALVGAAIFSGLINILALSSSVYMLQVYDRVIPSHSVPTLIGLSLAMLLLFVGYGILDVIRTRLMSRVGIVIDRELRDRVVALVLMLPLRAGASVDGLQPVRDLDQIRGFMAGAAPVALFDLPWMPLYLGLVWLLHPWLGLLALGGALTLVSLTLITEMRGRAPIRDMSSSGARRQALAEAGRRNAAAIRALGMSGRITHKWARYNENFLADQTAATDVIGTYGAISKVLRLVLQSAVLGLGAYLVIVGEATAGVMIASSILVSRALAPIEIAIANWRGFISARQSAARLSALLRAQPMRDDPLALPKPTNSMKVEGLFVAPPGQTQPIVQNVSFELTKGAGLGIIGPSAAGKSTLARSLIGAWQPLRGSVRLDGAALDQWSPDALGAYIGYLPQEIELLDGTVAENISRFEPDAPPDAIIEAARQAGVHDMIVRLPQGYDTIVGESGLNLSAGQRQRVALARALYRDPFLVVLDEPNSNLDREGDAALATAIQSVRRRDGIIIVIAHRPSALVGLDYILALAPGQPPLFGPKDEVLAKVMAQPMPPQPPVHPPAPPRASVQPARLPAPVAPPSPPAQAPRPQAPHSKPTAQSTPPADPASGTRLVILTDD